MQTLIELVPLFAFLGAYIFGGIYVATPVLMVSMLGLLAWGWFKNGQVSKLHLISAVLVWIFGAATLILHDVRFIQWKSTVFYWLIALVLAATCWIGQKTLLERLMTAALPADFSASPSKWKRMSLITALFYLVLGAANIWIAYNMTEKAWVMFKTWFMIPLVFVFTAGLMFWLLRDYESKDTPT